VQIIVCAPLAITAYIAWSFIHWVDSWVKPYIPSAYNPDNYLPFAVPGFGLLVALVIITLIGFLTANFIGRSIVHLGERLVNRTEHDVREQFSDLLRGYLTDLPPTELRTRTDAIFDFLVATTVIRALTFGLVDYENFCTRTAGPHRIGQLDVEDAAASPFGQVTEVGASVILTN